jgi:hypothetical protein
LQVDLTIREEVQRFQLAITALASSFRQEAGEDVFLAYSMALDDLPIEGVELSVRRAMRECKFMPTAAELRELANHDVSLNDRAVLAFEALSRAIKGLGPYKSVDFDDRAINATVKLLGGWDAVCATSEREFHREFRKRFEETYKVYVRNGVGKEQGRYLVGIAEKTNRMNGQPCEAPHLMATGLPYLDRVMDEPAGIEQQAKKVTHQRPELKRA